MVEKFADLGLEKAESIEEAEKMIQEKLGITSLEMKQALSNYVVDKAESLTHEFVNIAPLGDYGKLLEDNDGMAEFLKTEAHKPEHWELQAVRASDVNENLLSFEFGNKAVDDGDIFKGFVFVSLQGKIKHAFAQGDNS